MKRKGSKIAATVSRRDVVPSGLLRAPPLLGSGDRMTQSEFHRRYLPYPDDVTFELINGTVYLAPPTILKHGQCTAALGAILGLYEMKTPGAEALLHPSVILGKQCEPQPDVLLYVLPENGGRTWVDDDFLAGPPEVVIEVARNRMALEFHEKKDDYERNHIGEYIIICLEEERTHWFDLAGGRSRKMPPDDVLRSKMFPGLWIDTGSLFRGNLKQLFRVLNRGLASPEHARFLRRLAKAAETKAKSRRRPRKNGE